MSDGMATLNISPDRGYEIDSVFVCRDILHKQNGIYRTEVYADSEITVFYRPVGTALPFTFTDISNSDWCYDYISFCIRNGIFTGVTDKKFDPSGTLTRAMFVTALYRMCGEKKAGNTLCADVPEGTWYSAPVRWAIAKGITKAGSDGLFSPNKSITREEMAVMLSRLTGVSMNPWSMGISLRVCPDWAQEGVFGMSYSGVMDASVRPKDVATRAEAATAIARCMALGNF